VRPFAGDCHTRITISIAVSSIGILAMSIDAFGQASQQAWEKREEFF